MNKKEGIDLSIIITAHKEGIIAHKTMLSVFNAIEKIEEAKFTYEIIVHIDNGDVATKDYYSRYLKDKRVRIFENNFGDLGTSRSFSSLQARGDFVAFLDGDDLISDNWLVESIKCLKNTKEEVIVHPEAVLNFGYQANYVLAIQKESTTKEQTAILLAGVNPWTSTVAAKRETFEKYPYEKMGKGFGYEDYKFNIDTIAGGVKHIIAKDTVFFYRRSGQSMLNSYNSEKRTIPYSPLFDFDYFRSINIPQKPSKKKTIRDYGYKTYKKIRNNDTLNAFITPVAKLVLKILGPAIKPPKKEKIPKFVINEWTKINSVETQLYPHKNQINNTLVYKAENQKVVGETYKMIADKITKKPDYIFIVPWVVRGGGDKVMFNYIKGIKENNPDSHFLVISTLPAKNGWAKLLPEYVDFVDFGNLTVSMRSELKENLFTRVLIQSQCRNLHIINSEYGFVWASGYKELIKNNFNLNASIFCAEYIPESNLKGKFSYDDPYLVEIYPVVNKIFTDNKKIIEDVVARDGFSREKFRVHYQPIDKGNFKTHDKYDGPKSNGKTHILWASRITNTKMPAMVAEIGKRLDPKRFSIDVYGAFSGDIDKNIFKKIPSIKYCGPFDGFQTLPTNEKDMFLYTSLDDGVPNVILEAAASGLPIVASNDGGVSEFIIDKKTGILVKDKNDVDLYVEAIEEMSKTSSKKKEEYIKNAQKLLHEQHSWESFVKKIKEDF